MSDQLPASEFGIPTVDPNVINRVLKDRGNENFYDIEWNGLSNNPALQDAISHIAAEIAPGDPSVHELIVRAELLVIKILGRQIEIDDLESSINFDEVNPNEDSAAA